MVKIVSVEHSLVDADSPTPGMLLSQVTDLIEGSVAFACGFAQFDAGVRQPPTGLVARDQTEISLILSGSTELYTEHHTWVLNTGQLVVIPPGTANACKALSDLTVYYTLLGSKT